ncbi:MAG: amidase [Deltaproteobacteria bacterium]|nr:amidase [Deltaproteobacteria bacterium]
MTGDAREIAAQIRGRERSAADVVGEAIRRIEALDPALNAVVHPRFEKALDEASALERALARDLGRGDDPSAPLAGVPILLKDASITQAGEPWHEGLEAAKRACHVARTTSFLTQRLIDAGCIVLGRTNVPELCTYPTTEPVAYGPTRNPWHLDYSAGGSSGGSGAAVAAGMVPIAHGSDGGGSVRVPASLCGVVGLKPTRGRFSAGPEHGEHWGGISTDGFLARTVGDLAAVFDAVAGPHASDPVQTPLERPVSAMLASPMRRLRIGLRTRGACGGDPAHPVVDAITRETARRLEAAGHVVEEASPGALEEEEGVAQQGTVVAACLAAELAAWSRRIGREIALDELEPRNRMSVAGGRAVTGLQFVEAREGLFAWSRRLVAWFDDYDLLLTPVLTQPAIRIGELPLDPTAAELDAMRRRLGWLPGPWNVTGQPAISVPAGRTPEGLPVGIQLVAAWGREDLLLRVAAWLEAAQPWPHWSGSTRA